MRLYLDSSALVKLVRREAETGALRRYLRRHASDDLVSSDLARVEVVRAVLAGGPLAIAHARRVLARLHLMGLDVDLLQAAAGVATAVSLRSLDAIHLASAQLLGAELRAVLTYDARLASAAEALGLPVEAPR